MRIISGWRHLKSGEMRWAYPEPASRHTHLKAYTTQWFVCANDFQMLVKGMLEAFYSMRRKFLFRGKRGSWLHIWVKCLMAFRSIISTYFQQYEPNLIKARKANRLKRKRFWAAGVNDIWAVDQHDKWKYKFGLGLHLGTEPVSGRLLWLKVWWTNSNPRLILSYYLEAVLDAGGEL